MYDDWWEASGSDPRPDELRAAWLDERTRLVADLDEWCAGLAGASVLELAAGTGNLTCIAERHAGRLTAVDASPEVLEINAGKLGAECDRVDLVVADVFAWDPPTTYDAALFGFWISSGDDHIDAGTRITERRLPDGRSFRVVKRFFQPDELARDLAGHGLDTTVTNTDWAFLVGRGIG